MKFKPSILNIAAVLFLTGIIINTIFNYGQLSEGEGWGIVAMVGLFGLGIFLLIIDFIIQRFITNKKTTNIIGAFVVLIATLLLLLK